MKWKEWLDQWSLSSLKINLGFLETEWSPNDHDKDAAWELYVELITRITTQHLEPEHGDEKTALDSIFSLFGLTREILKCKGRHCLEFTRIAVVVLNQVVRPFTAKWHRLSLKGAFSNDAQCREFRKELSGLQANLRNYTRMLAGMASVEDLTSIDAQPTRSRRS
ncbi:MAG: hypothetical protein HS116_19370 [Planctomycetes bacterium]|nr:hypothetical protein [Planctomycetota bacterium]